MSSEEQDSINAALSGGDASEVNLDGDMSLTLKNTSSDGEAQDADFSESTGKKNVSLSEGDQNVTFNDEGGNVAKIAGGKSSETKEVNLGNGGDVVAIASDTNSKVSITAGRGADTIVAAKDASVDVSKGGATKVQAVGKAIVTMNNYDPNKKAGVQTSNSDLAEAMLKGGINLKNGVVQLGTAQVVINAAATDSADISADDDEETAANEGAMVVNLYNNAGKMTKVGGTYDGGGTADLSTQKASVLLQGNYTTTKEFKTGSSILLGGSGNDTIFAGSGDSINAGAGSNTVILQESRSADAESGATIQSAGRTRVQNFNLGFEDTSDVIAIDNLSTAKISADGNNVIIKSGTSKTSLLGSASSDLSADAADNFEIMIYNAASTEDDKREKTVVANEGGVITVSADEENFAKNYIGDESGLDFSSYDKSVVLALNGDSVSNYALFDNASVNVKGINSVKLGEGTSIVLGSAEKETIYAGSGAATIRGGAGADTLVGYDNSDDSKVGATTFMFVAGDGKDVISGFDFAADNLVTDLSFESVSLKDGNVSLKASSGSSDQLVIEGAEGRNIQINNADGSTREILQVADSSLAYDGNTTRYVAKGEDASVVVNEEVTRSATGFDANIWLDSAYSAIGDGKTYQGKIKNIDASALDGTAVLTGNDLNNSITSAKGDSWLWGGNSASTSDTLVGGDGNDIFFYGLLSKNEGNDVITNAGDGDQLFLSALHVADVSDLAFDGDNLKISFSSGGSVSFNYTDGAAIVVDGYSLAYDKDNDSWDVHQV